MDQQQMQQAAAHGVAKYIEWKQKFLADFGAAVQKGQLGAAFASVPPQLKEAMKTQDPEAYARITGSLSKR